LRALAVILLFLSPGLAMAADPPPVQHLPTNEASGILGRNVLGTDGQDMGRIIDVVVDQSGQPRAAVIDFGGFLGVGSRKIAVDWNLLHFTPGDLTKPITLDLTPDQIKAAPEYKENASQPPAVVAQPTAAAPPAKNP